MLQFCSHELFFLAYILEKCFRVGSLWSYNLIAIVLETKEKGVPVSLVKYAA